MSDAPGAPSDRFARLFEGAASVESAGACFALAGGQTLFAAGEPASAFYVLRTGRLGVLRQMDGQAPLLLGVIRPGEPAGEMALLADTAHTATVMALRDSEVFALPRAAFFAEAARDPRLMADVAQLMIRRARQPLTPMSTALPTVFSLIGCEATAARVLAGTLADALQTQGSRTVVAGAEALSRPTAWFSELEASHNLVLYAAEHGETEWIERCGRQADRLLLLGRGSARRPGFPAPSPCRRYAASAAPTWCCCNPPPLSGSAEPLLGRRARRWPAPSTSATPRVRTRPGWRAF